MHPIEAAQYMHTHGYTYTYYYMRNFWAMSRLSSLWIMWVARQYTRHTNGRTLMDDLF
jgi:hypothetical protein